MTREKAIKSLQFVRNALTDGMEIAKAYDMAIESLKQESTTKNDLGVDAISRADARKAIIEYQYSDGFCEEHNIDHSINTSMALLALSDLPSVTPQLSVPEVTALAEWTEKLTKASEDAYNKGYADGMKAQEPKTGHWILDETDNSITCDKCGCLLWANDISGGEAHYCPNCGAKMVESQESEDT